MKFKPFLLLMLFATYALAEPKIAMPSSPAAASNQASELRQAILTAQQDLAVKKDAQRKAQEELNRAKAALKQAQKDLQEINQKQIVTLKKLNALQADLNKLQADISQTKTQIGRLIASNYKNQQPPALALFLRNTDANQKSRFLMYTKHINAANHQVIQKLAVQQKQLAEQEDKVNVELDNLKKLTAAQNEKMQKLGADSSRAQAQTKKLNEEIARQHQKLAQLREDEQRLNRLVADVSNQKAAQAKAQAAAKLAQSNQQNSTLTREDLSLKPENSSLPKPVAVQAGNERFAQLQGRLSMPASGKVAGTFGLPRESGGTWHGLFIATPPTAVYSVADGEVAHVTNMSGYGNMILIDHGEGYMSVYTGLSKVLVHSGSHISARQAIGTSGTLPTGEQGVYFEIRYRNKTMNPRSWVR